MAVNYQEIGLVNTKSVFEKAFAGQYAIPAYNFNNMEQLQAIIMGCAESDSPFILQVSSGARKYANQTLLTYMAQGAAQMLKTLNPHLKFTLHLDHGDNFELCQSCIDTGFSSVMLDGSHHSFDQNIELTKKVVEYAHERDVTVEGELGVLAGIEDDVMADESTYTRPEEVEEFVEKTGVDSLAISIGTSHGANKFKPEQCTKNEDGVLLPPPLRFDILEEIERKIPGFPIVLHGASSVVPKVCDHDECPRGQAQGRRGNPRGTAPKGRQILRVQNQHRLGRQIGDDRHHPKGLRGQPRGVRPPQISGSCPGRAQEDDYRQKHHRFGLSRQGQGNLWLIFCFPSLDIMSFPWLSSACQLITHDIEPR